MLNRARALSFFIAFAITSCDVFGAVVTAIDRGWYSSFGEHIPSNPNYLVGYYSEYSLQTRNFFVFDLTGVSTPLAKASLVAYNPGASTDGYDGIVGSGTYSLYDVNTSISSLLDGTGGIAAFNDLGSGILIGSIGFDVSRNGTFVNVDFNSQGIAYLNANLGAVVAIGGMIPFDGETRTMFGFTNIEYSPIPDPILSYTPVPEPTSAITLSLSLAYLFRSRRKRFFLTEK
jgi:hypothetical protein